MHIHVEQFHNHVGMAAIVVWKDLIVVAVLALVDLAEAQMVNVDVVGVTLACMEQLDM
jgi:hypothetical protein